MLNSQNGQWIFPIVDEEDDVMLFETFDDAKKLADDHMACQAFGYEIFERGDGCI